MLSFGAPEDAGGSLLPATRRYSFYLEFMYTVIELTFVE